MSSLSGILESAEKGASSHLIRVMTPDYPRFTKVDWALEGLTTGLSKGTSEGLSKGQGARGQGWKKIRFVLSKVSESPDWR